MRFRTFTTSRSAVVIASLAALFAAAPRAQEAAVPADLKPLLAAPRSELHLVQQRYTLDRATLTGNYAHGSPGGRRGRGNLAAPVPGTAPSTPVPISAARIARLKRFDLSWLAALGRIDAAALTPVAARDLDAMKTAVAANLAALDRDALTLAQAIAAAPFAPKLVDLVEARIRVEDVDGQRAAAIVTDVSAQIARLKMDPPPLNKEQAILGATAVDQLRARTAEWFTFYDAYDPIFTWWMGQPYKQVDTALGEYAALLRDKVAAENVHVPASPAASAPVQPAAEPRYPDVPDLKEIIALPQDEMRDIVARFAGGGRGAVPARSAAENRAWLDALRSLDFDRMSRNAQVDYLFIRRTAETQIARAQATLDPNPPRKTDDSGIPGPARGRAGLMQDLAEAMIPYTPEQLIALAEKEFEWCDREMLKVSREMGFGGDWKKAIEKTKDGVVPPGGQPRMIMDLLTEAVGFLRANRLITVPAIEAESLHMIMMTPERQLVNPFFTGGGEISVSYPTNTMEYDARVQSMRGNNPGFSHATAFHEMIPGHNYTQFMNARFGDYRPNLPGAGPFYGEGWALYWELTMWDRGFHKTPEQRVGALFWRMHRCARIIFSLKFHMGQWSPQACIDFLVDRVGHERENAIAEVRRSFDPAAGYNALYQAAYLLGGLQIRGLHKEVVETTKQMTDLQFHDEIGRQGSMPIAMLRLALNRRLPLSRDMNLDWKFYGDVP